MNQARRKLRAIIVKENFEASRNKKAKSKKRNRNFVHKSKVQTRAKL